MSGAAAAEPSALEARLAARVEAVRSDLRERHARRVEALEAVVAADDHRLTQERAAQEARSATEHRRAVRRIRPRVRAERRALAALRCTPPDAVPLIDLARRCPQPVELVPPAAHLEPCLAGVDDEAALALARELPGHRLLERLEELLDRVDRLGARQDDPAATRRELLEVSDGAGVSDALLVETVAALERVRAQVTGLRDVAVGVLASRRRHEAETAAAAARAAAQAGGGRPPRVGGEPRSTAPSELAARLGLTGRGGEQLVERGLACLGRASATGRATTLGLLTADTGTWALDQLTSLHRRVRDSAVDREVARLVAQAADDDAAREATGLPPLSAVERAQRALEHEREAARLADLHADRVHDAAQASLLDAPRWTARASLQRRLVRTEQRLDPDGVAARAAQRRTARSVRRWSDDDGQAGIELRGPAEDVALIGAALDARARRRQADQRAAEREAAEREGRPVDRSATEPLDAHRFEALKEWAVAALELAGTSGEHGTWGPVARTAASRPVVSVTMPVTVAAGLTSVGAWLEGYGPLGAEAAERVARDAFWRRVFTDPVSGAAVGVEERTYRPSAGLTRLVRLRHRTSTLPGSTLPATSADLDHVEPWRRDGTGGSTTAENLHPLGRREHLLKHDDGGWSVEHGPSGTGGVTWRSPTGHTYGVPPDRLDDPPPGTWPDDPPW